MSDRYVYRSAERDTLAKSADYPDCRDGIFHLAEDLLINFSGYADFDDMNHRRDLAHEAPGQDSFLDVVANLVGIMIILIVIIGARTKDAIVEAATAEIQSSQASLDEKLADIAADAKKTADAIETDINDLAHRMEKESVEVEYRRQERDRVNLLIRSAEQELNGHRNKLSAAEQEQLAIESQLIAAKDELNELLRGRDFIENDAAQPTIIQHLPTPMAKTVFGKEIQFRLLNGRITWLPWDDMVERLKADAPKKIFKLKDQPFITETLGPIDGFWLKYALKRVEKSVQTNVGTAVQTSVVLHRFILVPTSEDLGEPIAAALQDGSQFRSILREHEPSRTTVTVWVYPDSFQLFRELKLRLFEMGYVTAARPLPEDHPIGGSPDGSRSAAQ